MAFSKKESSLTVPTDHEPDRLNRLVASVPGAMRRRRRKGFAAKHVLVEVHGNCVGPPSRSETIKSEPLIRNEDTVFARLPSWLPSPHPRCCSSSRRHAEVAEPISTRSTDIANRVRCHRHLSAVLADPGFQQHPGPLRANMRARHSAKSQRNGNGNSRCSG